MTSSPARSPNAAPSCKPRRRKQELRRAHLQSFVDRFKAKASKAVQAQSRVKMLEKMETITAPEDAKKVVFTFPEPEELSPPIINIDGGAVGYGGPPILRGCLCALTRTTASPFWAATARANPPCPNCWRASCKRRKASSPSPPNCASAISRSIRWMSCTSTKPPCNTSCACAPPKASQACAHGLRALV